MKKLTFFLFLILIGLSFLYGCQTQPKEIQPNIILILADDLGYNDLSCYRNLYRSQNENSPTCQTPNIDGLAEEGILFTDFYSGAAVCSPSRAALLTGRNKTRLGIYNWIPPNNPMHLRSEEITIAEMLKQKNYSTAHFGKWHLTSGNMPQPEPLDQGFDYAFWTHNNAIPSHENPNNFIRNRTAVGEINGFSSHIVIDETINWLTKQKENTNPFYINIWFHESHSKEAAPDSLKNRHNRNKAYYGCIENMDLAFGKLRQFLKENNLEENTIILFTSDNGSQYLGSNDPLRGEKCLQYEGGIRVPFIAYWKDKIPAKKISNSIGHFTDVFPTLATITKAALPTDIIIDGEDLSDLWLGKTEFYKRKNPLFFYRYFHDPICMLREGDFVLLGFQNQPKLRQLNYNEKEEALFKPAEGEPQWSQWSFQESHMKALKLQEPQYFELYNIKNDIGEFEDISKENSQLTERLSSIMLKTRTEMIEEGGDWYKTE